MCESLIYKNTRPLRSILKILICSQCISSLFVAMCHCLSAEGSSACQDTKILVSQLSLATDWNVSSSLQSRQRHQAPRVRNIMDPWVFPPWAAAGVMLWRVSSGTEPLQSPPSAPSHQPFTQLCVALCTPALSGNNPWPLWVCRLILHWGRVITHCCQAEHGCLSVALEELVFHLIYTSNRAN